MDNNQIEQVCRGCGQLLNQCNCEPPEVMFGLADDDRPNDDTDCELMYHGE